MTTPIRIFTGTEPKTEIARKVLEFSIRRHTTAAVEFTPMIGPAWEYAKDLKVGTGFSLRRWMIPAACNWEGLAVYLDADQLVFGDVAELLAGLPATTLNGGKPAVWCTWQPDKFYAQPAPQTSVMVIDCAAAREHWGFHIAQVEAYLRAHPDKSSYAKFMHAEWLAGLVGSLPVEWNHLNVHTKATKLLHYTKEPEQPWYKPDHPLAGLWQAELVRAIKHEAVTAAELKEALARWNVQEDWRTCNGLHPDYARFVREDKRKLRTTTPTATKYDKTLTPADPGTSKVLWVTSFNPEMYEASGRHLLASFRDRKVTGTLLACVEGTDADEVDGVVRWALDDHPFLRDWLDRNADVIPAHLGGKHDGLCRCPGGPFSPHDKRHRQPCVGHWFNRNASRWFRKIASLRVARHVAEAQGDDLIVWLDADCAFQAGVTARVVESWFRMPRANEIGVRQPALKHGAGVFYLKSTRPVLEGGVSGYNLKVQGGDVLDALFARYVSGAFRKDPRWDDCYQLQQAMAARPDVVAVDVARGVGKEHADVVPHSPLAPFLAHSKGKHGRILGIMT